MSQPATDPQKNPPGCDIPQPPPLSEVLDALSARSKARASAWGMGFRRWGSQSWGRAWALGMGLIVLVVGGLLVALASLNGLGALVAGAPGMEEWARNLASMPQPSATLARVIWGLGALGAATVAARTLLWLGVEGPIRLWSSFAVGVAGGVARASRHCFAPWTKATLCAAALCIPSFAVLGWVGTYGQEQSQEAAAGAASKEREERDLRAIEEARKQVEDLRMGRRVQLGDGGLSGQAKDAFWGEAAQAWVKSMDAVMEQSRRLSSPAEALQKNEAGQAEDRKRLASLEEERKRLINGYWVSLGLDRQAPHLAALRSQGNQWSVIKVNQPHRMAFCLPVPSFEHNEWMARQGAFSPQAKKAMALYMGSGAYSTTDPSFAMCGPGKEHEEKSLVALGNFLEQELKWVEKIDEPGTKEQQFFYSIDPRARRWAAR